MKLLFNLEVTESNRVKARPSDYLKSLVVNEQITAVTEFLQKLEQGAARIYTGAQGSKQNDPEN